MGEETSDILRPGVDITPRITIESSKKLIETLYGLRCKSIIELNGYDDKNYKIIAEELCDNEYISQISKNGYVLKILNSNDSKKGAFIEAQKDMMLFLGKHNIRCSKPILNKRGEYYSLERIKDSGDHVVRLLEYLPGSIFFNVPPTKELFFNAGQFLANLELTLKDFYHEAYKTHRSLWMLECVPEIKQFLYVLTNKDDIKMIEEIILDFESRVLRNLGVLEKSVIHGDFNEQNIVVCQDLQGEWKVDSILDFGDTQYSCLLFDLAIAVTYMIIQAKDIKTAGFFLAGYSQFRPIPQHEFNLLKVCVAARFCQSLVLGTYANLLHPDNQYVLTTQATGWTLLRKLWSEPDEMLIEDWKKTATDFQKAMEKNK